MNLANILLGSAADVEQEDAAMEESEEEPAQESNPLVTSLAARPEDSDSDTQPWKKAKNSLRANQTCW